MLDKIITAKAESMSVAVHGLPETFPWALLTALMAPISYRTGAGRGITEDSKACCMRAGWSHALFLYTRSKDLDVFLCPHGIAHCIQTYWLRCGWILVARLQTEFLYPWCLPCLVCALLSIVLTQTFLWLPGNRVRKLIHPHNDKKVPFQDHIYSQPNASGLLWNLRFIQLMVTAES